MIPLVVVAMKLVLKLPKDKPPFIGVQFNSLFQASRTNDDLLFKVKDKSCKVILEPDRKGTIRLKFICEDMAITRKYDALEYDQYQLKNWMHMISRSKQFNFGHVLMEENKHIIVKDPGRFNNFVLKLDGVSMTEEM